MKIWPLRFRELNDERVIVSDDAGGYFLADPDFVERYAKDALRDDEIEFLSSNGQAYSRLSDLSHVGFLSRWVKRQHIGDGSAYIILIPTLRCDLKCSYCQVSRASLNAKGFDWSEDTLLGVLKFLDGLKVSNMQIEFQGGEPLLRLDLLRAVTDFARQRFSRVSFVICTNLQTLTSNILDFLASDDIMISTSLDGPHKIHTKNRTGCEGLTTQFNTNLTHVINLFGRERISALPTIDVESPPEPEQLMAAYEEFGLASLYLRPINYQGFARKAHPSAQDTQAWNKYYRRFIFEMIDRNIRTGRVMEEFYLLHCLRRILASGVDNHTDLRNPNIPSKENLVVDYDGLLYPSDEARMLARIRRVDLSIGSIAEGIDNQKLALLAPGHINNFDPDCIHCSYQPYCGSDPIDDLSRSGRIDLPRQESWFCQRHLAVFDLAIELLYSCDPAVEFTLTQWLGIETISSALRPVAP